MNHGALQPGARTGQSKHRKKACDLPRHLDRTTKTTTRPNEEILSCRYAGDRRSVGAAAAVLAAGGGTSSPGCTRAPSGVLKDGVRTSTATRDDKIGDERMRALRCEMSAPRRRVSAAHAITCSTKVG